MKEIIYLNTKLVNSMLAQLNTGLITKLINEQGITDTKGESTNETVSSTLNYKGSITVFSGGVTSSDTSTDATNVVFSKNNKDLIESALDDYSLDILLNNLQKENIIKNENLQDGNLILSKGSISSYNFNHLQDISNLSDLKDILPDYEQFCNVKQNLKKAKFGSPNYNMLKKQLTESTWYNFKIFHDMSMYANNLLKENTLIKINEFVSICENQYIRLSTPQLYFNNFSDKNITVLAVIITKINEKVPNDFSKSLSESNDFFKNGPALISNIIFGSSSILDENDFIVRPIAIYYDLK